MKTVGTSGPSTLSKKLASRPKLSAKNMGSKSMGLSEKNVTGLKATSLGSKSMGTSRNVIMGIKVRG